MIYTSIRAVPRWNHFSTPVLFPAVSIAGGALLAGQNGIAIPLLIIAGAWQLLVWHWGDQQFGKRGSTIKTATGLGQDGDVRLFEGPHTGTSYLTREMVFQYLPLGGIHFAGSVARGVLSTDARVHFLKMFESDGPFSELIGQVPVKVITDDTAALVGVARYARNTK